MLDRVEVVVRAIVPRLSCSTHALEQMALQVQQLATTCGEPGLANHVH